MTAIFESIERYPVTFGQTGDRALLVAWAMQTAPGYGIPDDEIVHGVLILEDGSVRVVPTTQFTFDYRYDIDKGVFVDVSRLPEQVLEDLHADTDQAPEDDGGQAVQGRVPDVDGASEGDPNDLT